MTRDEMRDDVVAFAKGCGVELQPWQVEAMTSVAHMGPTRILAAYDRAAVRPRNTAGVATMARLMQRTRDERDFGGAVDDDA
jgi:hypothetical protein